jgi:hypothetical protein
MTRNLSIAALLLAATPSLAAQSEAVSYVRVQGFDVTGCALLTLQVDAAPSNAVMAYSVYDSCIGGYTTAPGSEPVPPTDLVLDRKGNARFRGLTFTRTAAKCITSRSPMGAYLTTCPALATGTAFGLTLDRVSATTGSYR